MFPYWLLFALFAAGAVQFSRVQHVVGVDQHGGLQHHSGRSAILLGVAAALMAALIGFRYEVGGDWQPYLFIFREMSELPFGAMIANDDPGYNLLNWLASIIGVEIWAVNLTCGAVFCWGLAKFANHQPNPWLAVVVAVPYLVIVVALGYTRQAVAIGLIMAAIVYWDRSAIIKFALCIVIGAAFHKTAMLALPLIALSSSRNRFVTGILVVLFGFLLYRYFLAESIDRLMVVYVESEYSSQGAAIRVAMNFVPAVLFLFLQKRFEITDSQRRMWRYFAFAALATVPMLVLFNASTAVDRIALYLIPLQLFVFARLPEVFSRTGQPNARIGLMVVFYSALIQFVWLNFANHAEYWVPYEFWPFIEGAETTPIDRY